MRKPKTLIFTSYLKNRISLITLLLLFLGGAYLYFGTINHLDSKKKSTYFDETGALKTVVTLTEQGFDPSHIKIKKGTQVEFRTNQENPFWPASNTHPWHRIYSAFDPRQPVEPKDSWSFIFNQVGTWGYHDHLRSFFTGVIEVVD